MRGISGLGLNTANLVNLQIVLSCNFLENFCSCFARKERGDLMLLFLKKPLTKSNQIRLAFKRRLVVKPFSKLLSYLPLTWQFSLKTLSPKLRGSIHESIVGDWYKNCYGRSNYYFPPIAFERIEQCVRFWGLSILRFQSNQVRVR